MNVAFMGAPLPQKHTEKLTEAENVLERRDPRNHGPALFIFR